MPTAREIYDTAPIGSRVAFNDGTKAPPPMDRLGRLRPAFRRWAGRNGDGHLIRRCSEAAHLKFFVLEIGEGMSATEKLFALDSGLRFEVLLTPGAQPKTEG